jgi:hypothetical protein
MVPRGREWVRRWEALDEDVRAHIRHKVYRGETLREAEWAEMATALARYLRRDTALAITTVPVLLAIAVIVGTAAGRWSRGGDLLDAVVLAVTWRGGLAWLGIWLVSSGLLALVTRGHRRRLRAAETRNRGRAHTPMTSGRREAPHDADRPGTGSSPVGEFVARSRSTSSGGADQPSGPSHRGSRGSHRRR